MQCLLKLNPQVKEVLMTDSMSPAAQAIKDAVLALYSDEKVHKFGWQLDAPTVAAALRAAVAHTQQHRGLDVWECDADELLAIASELEGLT
jgi:hypothetical protein